MSLNRRQHAELCRLLIAACGGLEESVAHCRVSKTRLADYQAPGGETFMPGDVIADLEAYCGEPVYSRVLVAASPNQAAKADLLSEIFDVSEGAVELQAMARKAKAGGLTERERRDLADLHAKLTGELRDVGDLIGRGEA